MIPRPASSKEEMHGYQMLTAEPAAAAQQVASSRLLPQNSSFLGTGMIVGQQQAADSEENRPFPVFSAVLSHSLVLSVCGCTCVCACVYIMCACVFILTETRGI